MAARVDAATRCSSLVSSYALKKTYTRTELISLKQHWTGWTPEGFDSFPERICRRERTERRRRRRCERRLKRGKRAGIRARLTATPHKPAVPSVFLANVRSLVNKMDEIKLRDVNNRIDSCIMVITETWLHENIPDLAVELAGRTIYRADRTSDSGKARGGGVCVYINNSWCTDTAVIERHCCPDLEFLLLKCRPFYLPREITQVFVAAVYIHPRANANVAMNRLHDSISRQQNKHPEGFFIVAGDFNHTNLKTVLPRFYKNVDIKTRKGRTLDQVYTNISGAYKARPSPHLGHSDHLSLFLIPAYKPLVCRSKPQHKSIQCWTEEATLSLQDCFEDTIWELFEEPDIELHTSSVLSYISFCIDSVTTRKQVKIFPNQKPWFNTNIRALLQARDSALRSGDREAYRKARVDLNKGIKAAKAKYREQIEANFRENNPRSMWKGIQNITDYKQCHNTPSPTDTSLPDQLNAFFSRFEEDSRQAEDTQLTPSEHDQPPTIQQHQVLRVLRGIDTSKAPGPDGIPGKVLKSCAHQLAAVFTNIFNRSLQQATVPTCLKTATIIPVPKSSAITGLNDYRPVALTPVIMKCMERLVLQHVKAHIPPGFDQHQFAYRSNRSTDDAISIALHTALNHIESPKTYIRMLFVDFSSAFNSISPSRLINKLQTLQLGTSLCLWIKDFLTNRPQHVRMGTSTSSTIILNTGVPQGCVLSPVLYTLYTHDCVATHGSNTLVKFADDTTIVGLINNDDEAPYREEVRALAAWCSDNHLNLNTRKTKELIIDFRKTRTTLHSGLSINGEEVERVKNFKFLGLHISEDLGWTVNTTHIIKKAQQRLFFLRMLRRNKLPPPLLKNFYYITIECPDLRMHGVVCQLHCI